MEINNRFTGRKIAVLGLSTEGQTMIKYLRKHGVKIWACDKKEKKDLGKTYYRLKRLGAIFQLGPSYLDDLEKFDLVFRTPGMPLRLPQLKEARKRGIEVSSQIKLFFNLCPCPIIGVTGTKGKGTTVTLIGEILKNEGKKVFVGGNIGSPPIEFLDKLTPSSWVVLELSSFQLEDLTQSPNIAVVLNITSDHVAFPLSPDAPNYHLSWKDYVRAKKNIVRYQTKEDFALINADYEIPRSFIRETPAKIFYFSRKEEVSRGAYVQGGKIWLKVIDKARKARQEICRISEVGLRGVHNLENITASMVAASLAGVNLSSIRKTVLSFRGLEHRLELVKEAERVEYFNDSFSTIPETTIAAIRSFKEPIILIAGGSEKGADYTELGKEIAKSTVRTLILIGEMAERIEEAVMKSSKLRIIKGLKNMKDIVKIAKKEAKPGDIVLLSPACASFDMFKNYKDRGEQFKYWVKSLNEKKLG